MTGVNRAHLATPLVATHVGAEEEEALCVLYWAQHTADNLNTGKIISE